MLESDLEQRLCSWSRLQLRRQNCLEHLWVRRWPTFMNPGCQFPVGLSSIRRGKLYDQWSPLHCIDGPGPTTSKVLVQGRLEQLPAELWARVLQQLSTRDLLRARHVSKHFVCLSNLLQLHMCWTAQTEATRDSLALFVRCNCSDQMGPHARVDIVTICALPKAVWPYIVLATECSNLVSLTCNGYLGQSEAAACIRLLPSTLELLTLDTTLGLISDPDLYRMQRLTHLSLSGSCEAGHDSVTSAAGLQGLRSLQVFRICQSRAACETLDAATFVHPSLNRLELEYITPLQGKLIWPGSLRSRPLAFCPWTSSQDGSWTDPF